jgi:alpha,alpha-trehalase
VWHVINNRIGLGFSEVGEHERAERIRKDSEDLIAQSSFYEYFNPITGDGLGGKDFTWTASVYLDWVMQEADHGQD